MSDGGSINRRGFMKAAGVAACWAAGRGRAARGASLPDTSKMNVLIFNMEDWTANAIGCYGNAIPKTPNIDKLAASGVRFNRAYIQYPCCNPSRSSFWTGLRPPATGVLGNPLNMQETLPAGTQSLPQMLKARGFHTGVIAKLFHHVDQAEEHMRVFDRIELSDKPKGWTGPGPVLKFPSPKNPDPMAGKRKGLKRGTKEWNRIRRMSSDRYGDSGQTDTEMTDGKIPRVAVKLLEEFARDKKHFALFVGSSRPHTPLICPKKYIDMYDPAKIPAPAAPPEKDRGVPDIAKKFGRSSDIFMSQKATPAQAREAVAAYYACATFVDVGVGMVLDALDRTGLADNTIVVFFSDHGFHLGEHGTWSKYTLFEPSTRVPLIVRIPGAAANGRVSEGIVELVDLVPTLKDLCGLSTTNKLEGTSFAPLLADPKRPWKKGAFTWFGNQGQHVSVRTQHHKYAEWVHKGERIQELYDLRTDPWETVNLAGDPAHATAEAAHAKLLKAGWKAALPDGVAPGA